MTSTGHHILRQEGIKLQEPGTTEAEEGRFSECGFQPGNPPCSGERGLSVNTCYSLLAT